ncbi:MAG: hypothetical protein GX558_04695 [Clostridiales bacterium]|nr:hypothetical protein [Clostridiales bacterium]
MDSKLPKSISVPSRSITMYVGEVRELTAATLPAGSHPEIRWSNPSSASRAIAAVSASGQITARKKGVTTITVASARKSSVKTTIKVTVFSKPTPASIAVSPNGDGAALRVPIGAKFKMTATPQPAGTSASFKWKSSSTSRATVSSTGVVTARAAGNTYITVYSTQNAAIRAIVPVTVYKPPVPGAISLSAPATTVDKGKTIKLTPGFTPSEAVKTLYWVSSNTGRATVSSSGVVTAKSGGAVVITAISKVKSTVRGSIALYVEDPRYPKSVTFADESPVLLDTLQSYALKGSVLPSIASQSLKWVSSKTAVATVSSAGVVTGKANGTAVITAYSAVDSSVKASITVQVAARAVPTALALTAPSGTDLLVGKTMQLGVVTTPLDASQMFTFTSNTPTVAGVNTSGVVLGRAVGKSVITVASKKKTTVKASITINVYNAATPNRLTLSAYSAMLGIGDTVTIESSVFPSSAAQSVKFTTSKSSVATVSSAGVIKAAGVGTATITCTTSNGKLSATAKITVIQTELTKTTPDLKGDVSGITANVAKIEAIRRSAVTEVAKLDAGSVITGSEASDRTAVINRAFRMLNFPWMTATAQNYWSTSSVKYVPGAVYYGMPYTQKNRTYNEVRATSLPSSASEKYFYSSGKGYYLMSRKNFVNGSYVGNDCSSFVSMSEFGTGHAASTLNTTAMYGSTYYKTISSWDNLRPGDVLVRKWHTMMFLYYTNSAKTNFMVIEQGGGTEPNTVAARIKVRATLSGSGYIARRKVSYK